MYTPPDCTMPKQQKRQNKRNKAQTTGSMVPRPLIRAVTRAQLGWIWAGRLTESASGVGAFQTFRMNDLYDPDFTGTGTQPVAFDQLSALYSRFRVLKLRVQFSATTIAALTGCMLVMYPSSSSTLPSGCQSWPLQPYAMSKFMAGREGSIAYDLKATYSMAKVMGITQKQYMDEMDFTCTPTNSPLRGPYLHVGIFTRYGVIGQVDTLARFIFEVECSQPVANDLS